MEKTQQHPDANAQPVLLIVDDERVFADTLAFRLAACGLPSVLAYQGKEAVELLDRPELEVVLLDLHMPGASGLDILRQIKKKRPEVEVLLLTGEANFSAAATGMRRGAGDYLLKPVDFPVLLQSIDKARKRCQAHKERLRAAEAGRLMALGALAAGVGHEINNPLQVILQRSELLQDLIKHAADHQQPDWAEMSDAAETIQRQVIRAAKITGQLLDLAHKSRTGQATTHLADLVDKTIAAQQLRADALNTTIHKDVAVDLPVLPYSAAELAPVLRHLLQNSLDAIEAAQSTNNGGKGEKIDQIRISVRLVDNMIRIICADSGEGIAPEHVSQIFDPFFSTRAIGQGTGLGLTVCHSIITALRGQIRCAPEQAVGTVFTVDLPL